MGILSKIASILRRSGQRGQHTIEYAVLLILVMAGIIVMGRYVIRSWNANVKGWEDSARDSFEDPLTELAQPQIQSCNVSPWIQRGCGLGYNDYCSGQLVQCAETEMTFTRTYNPIGCQCGSGAVEDVVDCQEEPLCCTVPLAVACNDAMASGPPPPPGTNTGLIPTTANGCPDGFMGYSVQCGGAFYVGCRADPACLVYCSVATLPVTIDGLTGSFPQTPAGEWGASSCPSGYIPAESGGQPCPGGGSTWEQWPTGYSSTTNYVDDCYAYAQAHVESVIGGFCSSGPGSSCTNLGALCWSSLSCTPTSSTTANLSASVMECEPGGQGGCQVGAGDPPMRECIDGSWGPLDNPCEPLCGDGNCDAFMGENCNTCPADCGTPNAYGGYNTCPSYCGDGNCDSGEDCNNCPSDCTSGCGGGNTNPPTCTLGNWVNGACGGSCPPGQRLQTRTVSPAGCDATSRCISDSTCITCNTGNWVNGACGGPNCSASQRYQTRTVSPSGCASSSRCVSDSTCCTCPAPSSQPCGVSIIDNCGNSCGTIGTDASSCDDSDLCTSDSCSSSGCVNTNIPNNGSWSSWNNWSPCSNTCGSGTRSRSRTCTYPNPSCPTGTGCSGLDSETENCVDNSGCCGNNTCDSGETCGTCPSDCGSPCVYGNCPSWICDIYQNCSWQCSDINLKEHIVWVGTENGLNIYEFNFKDGAPCNMNAGKRYTGVLAQEIQKSHPKAVRRMENGYLAVDYSQIGVQFREVLPER